ncbi:MAG: glycosyltransferase family 2 protein [Flavobacteriaceae bacterium]
MANLFEVNKQLKKSKVVVFTTVFPNSYKYLDEFLNSLQTQTFLDFDLFIVNDGVEDLSRKIKKYDSLNTIIIDVNFTISKNREVGINHIVKLGYEYVVFIDSDDYVENNRLEVSLKKIKNFDIIVNELSLFDEKSIYNKNYFSKRIENDCRINESFIVDKNIFGLSNTTVKVSLLKGIEFNKDLKVVDWFLFNVLLSKGATAIFTNQTKTYYRQYDDNLSSIDKYDKKYLINCISVKKDHYKEMSPINEKYKQLYRKCQALESAVLSNNYTFDYKKENEKNLFWWEITNYLNITN